MTTSPRPLKLLKPFETLRRRQREDFDEESFVDFEDERPVTPRPSFELITPLSAEAIRRKRIRSWAVGLAVLLAPMVLTAVYLGFIAEPVYQVEAIIMIRNPPSSGGGGGGGGGGLTALLKGGGGGGASIMSRAMDESFAVIQYIASREAYIELEQRIGKDKVFQSDTANQKPTSANLWTSWAGSPTSTSFEDRFAYYTDHVNVSFDEITGQIDLKVLGHDAKASNQVAIVLLAMSEELVNQFNSRSERDFIEHNKKEVERTHDEFNATSDQITKFRFDHNLIDPNFDGSAVGGIITGLLTAATSVQAEISNMIGRGMTSDAQLRPLRIRLAALQEQIQQQKSQLTGQGNSLAPVLTQYATLGLAQQIAQQQYTSALNNLAAATFQANSQKLYIVNVVSPYPPEEAQFPDRRRAMTLAIIFSVVGFAVFRTVASAIRDHMVG